MRLHLLPAIAIALASLNAPAVAQLPVNDEPLTGKWAPSEWGPDDKVGAPNRTTPELVLKAVGLVKKGKSATLGKVYEADAPTFGARSWKLLIPGRPTGGPFGDQQLVYNDEYVATELGQIGTQFDGPAISASSPRRACFITTGASCMTRGSARPASARSAWSMWRRRVSCAAEYCSTRWRCAAERCRCPRKTVPAIPAS